MLALDVLPVILKKTDCKQLKNCLLISSLKACPERSRRKVNSIGKESQNLLNFNDVKIFFLPYNALFGLIRL